MRLQNRYKYRDRGIDLDLLRVIKAYYYATISFVDFQVGRMLQALETAGQLDNTLVVFTSDHGELLGDYHCFGKRSMHDASSRVPLLARLPDRFAAGARCSRPASLVDVYATVLAACGEREAVARADGHDLTEVAAGRSERTWVYSQFERGGHGVYMAAAEEAKYVYSAGDRKESFFDRRTDPLEAENLAGRADAPPALARMRAELLAYLHRAGAADAVSVRGADPVWAEHPPIDERYLATPDARLLFQDYPSYPTCLPGYTDEAGAGPRNGMVE